MAGSKTPEPIKIVSMDAEGATPSGLGALKHIPLKLSERASHTWSAAFNTLWQQHFYMQKRKAEAHGDRITVTCMDDELANGLLDELKKVVGQTNDAVQVAAVQAATAQAQKQATAEAEKQKLAEVAKKLNFD